MFKIFLTKHWKFDTYTSEDFYETLEYGRQLKEEFILYFNDTIVGECMGANLTWILVNSNFYERTK